MPGAAASAGVGEDIILVEQGEEEGQTTPSLCTGGGFCTGLQLPGHMDPLSLCLLQVFLSPALLCKIMCHLEIDGGSLLHWDLPGSFSLSSLPLVIVQGKVTSDVVRNACTEARFCHIQTGDSEQAVYNFSCASVFTSAT